MANFCMVHCCFNKVEKLNTKCEACAKRPDVKVERVVPKPVDPTYNIIGLTGPQYMDIMDALHIAEQRKRDNHSPVYAERYHQLRLALGRIKQRDV